MVMRLGAAAVALAAAATTALSAASASAAPHSLRLHHSQPPHFSSSSSSSAAPLLHADRTLLKPRAGERGVALPMSGGTLTVGAFFLNVSIGSGARTQTFEALVDTGSSNLWVTGFKEAEKSATYAPVRCNDADCTRCNVEQSPACSGELGCLFGPPVCDRSADHCQWGITYGGGGTMETGLLSLDRVCLGPDRALCTTTAPFGEVTRSVPSQGALGAIIGMAFPRNGCNPSCPTTVMQAIPKENKEQDGTFSMCLTQSNGGVLDMGFVNQSRLAGPVTTLAVTHPHWYNLAVTDLSVGGVSSGLPLIAFSVTNDVIGSFVDSGTTVLGLGPLPFGFLASTFTTRYATLPGAKELFAGQCVAASVIEPVLGKYPPIVVHIDANGGAAGTTPDIKTFPIPPSSYLFKAGSQYCLGIAQINGIGAILGATFLENYVAVYNPSPTNPSVGLAPLKPGSCSI